MFPLVEKDQEVSIVSAMLLWLTYYPLIKLVINFFLWYNIVISSTKFAYEELMTSHTNNVF